MSTQEQQYRSENSKEDSSNVKHRHHEQEINDIVNNVPIEAPAFSFLFTISMDGRIDIYDNVFSNANHNARLLNKKRLTRDRMQRKVFSTGKINLASEILNSSKCNNCEECQVGIEPFEYIDLEKLEQRNRFDHFMAKAFLDKAIIGCWKFNTKHDNSVIESFIKALQRFNEEKSKEQDEEIEEHIIKDIDKQTDDVFSGANITQVKDVKGKDKQQTDVYQKRRENLKECFVNEVTKIEDNNGKKVRYAKFISNIPAIDIARLINQTTIEIKLMATGSLSILVNTNSIENVDSCNIKVRPKNIIDLISQPDLAVNKRRYAINENGELITDYNKIENQNKGASGFLNIFAYELASHVFNEFFICLSNKTHKETSRVLKVMRIYKADAKDQGRNFITTRYNQGRYNRKIIKTYLSKRPNFRKIGLSERVDFSIAPNQRQKSMPGKGFLIYEGTPDSDRGYNSDEEKLYRYYCKHGTVNDVVNLFIMFSVIKKRTNTYYNQLNTLKYLVGKVTHDNNITNGDRNADAEKALQNIEKYMGLLWKAPLYSQPYIGVQLYKIPEEYIHKSVDVIDRYMHIKDFTIHVLTAIATQTKEFMLHLNIPHNEESYLEYLRERSIFRGTLDVMIVEKRCVVVARGRSHSNEIPHSNLINPIETHYNNLLFCFESIFATTKSVSSFNKELEESISWKVTDMLNGNAREWQRRLLSYKVYSKHHFKILLVGIPVLYIILLKILQRPYCIHYCVLFAGIIHIVFLLSEHHPLYLLRNMINQARTLSPCEDFSSNIEPSLRTESSIKAVNIAKKFGLDILVKTVHDRLDSYGHFLKTRHETLIIQVNGFLSVFILYIACITLTYTSQGGKDNKPISLSNLYEELLTDRLWIYLAGGLLVCVVIELIFWRKRRT